MAARLFSSVLSRNTGLLCNATVVLSTNQLQWLPRADRIIVLGSKKEAKHWRNKKKQQIKQQELSANQEEELLNNEADDDEDGDEEEGVGGTVIVDQGQFEELVGRGHDFSTLSQRMSDARAEQEKEDEKERRQQQTVEEKTAVRSSALVDDKDGASSSSSTFPILTATNEDHTPINIDADNNDAADNNNHSDDVFCIDSLRKVYAGPEVSSVFLASSSPSPIDERSSSVDSSLKDNPTTIHHSAAPPDSAANNKVSSGDGIGEISGEVIGDKDGSDKGGDDGDHHHHQLVSEEVRASGAVKLRVYQAFLGSVRSPKLLLAFLACAVASQASSVAQQTFLAAWSSDPTYKRLPLTG